jgi:hypothetical protein
MDCFALGASCFAFAYVCCLLSCTQANAWPPVRWAGWPPPHASMACRLGRSTAGGEASRQQADVHGRRRGHARGQARVHGSLRGQDGVPSRRRGCAAFKAAGAIRKASTEPQLTARPRPCSRQPTRPGERTSTAGGKATPAFTASGVTSHEPTAAGAAKWPAIPLSSKWRL